MRNAVPQLHSNLSRPSRKDLIVCMPSRRDQASDAPGGACIAMPELPPTRTPNRSSDEQTRGGLVGPVPRPGSRRILVPPRPRGNRHLMLSPICGAALLHVVRHAIDRAPLPVDVVRHVPPSDNYDVGPGRVLERRKNSQGRRACYYPWPPREPHPDGTGRAMQRCLGGHREQSGR